MNFNFENFFIEEIENVAKDIYPLINYNPSIFNIDINGMKDKDKLLENKSISIAKKIVKVEAFLTLVSELNYILNSNINSQNKENKDEIFINLCSNVEDLTSLFFSSRPTYWHYLNFEGKVLEQRIRILFLKWGFKYQLGLDMLDYFEELDRLLKVSYESKIPFFVLVDSLELRKNIDTIKVEDILETKIFSENGIYILSEYCFNKKNKSKLENNKSVSEMRQHCYLHKIFDNFICEDEVKIKGMETIKKYLESPKDYSIVAKTTQQEYFIANENNKKIFNKSISYLSEIEALKIEKKDKSKITLSFEDLYSAARELDIELDDLSKFREKNLKEIDFIDVKTKEKCDELTFDGFKNFVGMVNTGKTNFMVCASYALAKKGFKTCLVLRDNRDVLEQLENLNTKENINAVALLGSSSKLSHTFKIINSNFDKVKKSRFVNGIENSLDILDDERFDYGSYCCPIKSLFSIKEDNTSDIYITNHEADKTLCNNLYIRKDFGFNNKNKSHSDTKITCPFSDKCDSLKANKYFPDANIFITNMASFIKTDMNKLYFPNSERVAKYIYDVCDLVMIDESDAMQFQFDSAFSDSMPIYNDIDNPSILEKVKDYKEIIRGNVEKYREPNRLLFRLTKTEALVSAILDKFTQNKIPNFFKNGPLVSRKVFNSLAYLLSRNPQLLKSNVDSLNGLKFEYFNEEETKEEETSLIEISKLFKEVHQFIYQVSSHGLSSKEYSYLEKNEEVYLKYKNWIPYLDSIYGYGFDTNYLSNIYSDIKNKNIILPETQEFIESNPNAKLLILELISLAILLTSVEADLNKITNTTGYVKSTLYDISNKDIGDIPSTKGYVKDYIGLTSRCPLGLYFGLKYNKDKKSLDMISWEGIGRDLLYLYDELWSYKENNKNSGINIATFSGTSFMPTSPLYHILKDVDYLMKSNTSDTFTVNQYFEPIYDEHGNVVLNSGINKSKEEVANNIYKKIAAGLTDDSEGLSRLSRYLSEYTFKGRERILLSVGNYKDALRLASFLYELNKETNIEVAALYKEGIDDNFSFSLPSNRRINKDTIKRIDKTSFNIVVVPQSAIQRGINMLKSDVSDDDTYNKKMVASFSAIVKTNRDYQVPNNHMYAVSRVSYILEKEKQSLLKNKIDSNYSLSKEVSHLFSLAEKTYNDYYSDKFFSKLNKEERYMLLGDSIVEDVQFLGRSIRGNVSSNIISLDGAFFRNYTKGEVDNEKTSTIVAIKHMCDEISKENDTYAFLINELYGPFLKGINQLLENIKTIN